MGRPLPAQRPRHRGLQPCAGMANPETLLLLPPRPQRERAGGDERDDRKRGYNGLAGGDAAAEVTPEEMEVGGPGGGG